MERMTAERRAFKRLRRASREESWSGFGPNQRAPTPDLLYGVLRQRSRPDASWTTVSLRVALTPVPRTD